MPQQQPRIVQDAAARAMLRSPDYPPQIKAALALCLRGGRLPRQRCRVCGKRSQSMRRQVYIPCALLAPLPDPAAKCVRYLLCERCDDRGIEVAVIEAKLQRQRR